MVLHATPEPAPLVRYGLVGPGEHATENLLPALTLLEGSRLVGVAARSTTSAAAAARQWRAARYTDDWAELADPAVVDAVLVSATSEVHARVLRHCLDAGIHVFAEKPPAPDLAVMRDLAAREAAAPGVVAFVGFNFPYGTSYRLLQDRLRPHGEVRGIDVSMISAKPLTPDPGHATVLESLLYGLGTHAVDLAVRTLGQPGSVDAYRMVVDGVRQGVRIILGYPDGRQATLRVGNYSNRLEYRCELVTDQSVVGILDQHNALQLHRPGDAPGPRLLDRKETLRYDWPSRRGGYDRTGYRPELASFQESIVAGRASTSSLAACLAVYEVLDQVRHRLVDRD
ncbi:Gfo/Idh/MocA family oxidoreductase [Actinoplanes sp. NPDC051859]|uniref:Gfo/Idh/MocA family oxidoreductase n=1 Tax=Actinoplanes sp. NPDC051859 TaxID=3363909 RepID=UPI00379A93C6